MILIRHGESRATVDRVIGGHHGCRGLTGEGIRQAESLRDRLQVTAEVANAAALYSSRLQRAVETAEILCLPGLGVTRDCDLCELHDGDEVDGLTVEEVQERYWAPAFAAGRTLLTSAMAPGGESKPDFVARVTRGLDRLVARHRDETIVVVTHGGPIRASFTAFGGLPLEQPLGLYVENTSITEWRAEDVGRPWAWGLHRFNDHAHLGS